MIIYHDTFANTNHCPAQLGFDFGPSNNGSGESCRSDGHDLLTHVRDYIRRGWHVFPLAPRTKEPVEGWPWTSRCVGDDRADFVFSGTENGIGIGLGDLSNGLIDIDLDWAEARDIADVLLSDLPAFGREGTPRSHRLTICDKKSQTVKFRLPAVVGNDPRLPDAHALCVAELRGSGGYTMFPGSTHPNGEQVTWDVGGAPEAIPETDLDDLHRHVGLIAFLAVVVRFYPAQGRRDEFCMALTGTLLRSLEAWKPESLTETVDHLVKLVARLAHDEEHRTRGKARETWKKIQAGEPATGFPTLVEILGWPEQAGETIREWISLGPEGDERRPVIHIGSNDLEIQLNRAEAALDQLGASVFQRGKKLVRVIRQDYRADQSARIQGQSGSLLIEDIEPYWLAEQLHKAASFVRITGKKTNPTKVTHEFCNHLIVGRRGNWKWPVLKGIIEAPTLRPDWTVLQDHGYDAATGLLLDFGETVFGRIPDNPTRQDAEDALNRFIEIVRGFPFAPDAIPDDWSPTEDQGKLPSSSRSVVLSAWLTGLIRRSLRTAPLHAIDAPTMGTGKSKLADIIAVIMTGRCASVVSHGPSEEEMEKRLFAMLYAGCPAVVIDNIERSLEGEALCSILTQEKWKGRILGRSETPELPTNALFIATGNNLTFRGDLTRRAISCRLDARSERPDERKFDFDPVNLTRQNRPDLVVAGLTIVRAYIVAGHPLKGTVHHIGSFEDWTLIREALIWLGQPDPASTRVQVFGDDPRQHELAGVLDAWENCYGTRSISLADVKRDVENANHFEDSSRPVLRLGEVLKDLSKNGEINPRSLGHWFKHQIGVIVKGRHFERVGTLDYRYRLVRSST